MHNILPHHTTIQKWYRGYDCSPGFSTDALMSIKMLAADAKEKNEPLYASLIYDEMKIREQVIYENQILAMRTMATLLTLKQNYLKMVKNELPRKHLYLW